MAQRTAYIMGLQDKTTLAFIKDSSGNVILYQSPKNYVPGADPPTQAEVIMWERYTGPLSAITDVCGVAWVPIDVDTDPEPPENPVFVFGQFKIEQDTNVLPTADYRGSVDRNDCDQLEFWAVNLSDPSKPVTVTAVCDGVFFGKATVSFARTDVVTAFSGQGITLPTSLLGGRIVKNGKFRDSQPHTWQLFFEDTDKEFPTYNQPKTIICAKPADPNSIIRTYAKVSSILEGGPEVKFQAFDVFADLSEKLRTDFTTYDWENLSFEVRTRHVGDDGKEFYVSIPDNVISEDKKAIFVIKDGNLKVLDRQEVLFINKNNCVRPGNLQTVGLSYRIKTNAGPVYGYSTLDDAINYAGKKFDGTLPGDLDIFTVQIEGLYVGARVFLGTGSDCSPASNNFYFVTATDGTNVYKVAIQVFDGKIAAIKYSTYTTNTPPIAAAIPDQTSPTGTAASYTIPANTFTDPGDQLTLSKVDFPAGFDLDPATGKVTKAANVPAGSYTIKIKATDSVGQSIVAQFTYVVSAQTGPYIDKIAVVYPQYWRQYLPSYNRYEEAVAIYAHVAGTGADNAVVVVKYVQSTQNASFTPMGKTLSSANQAYLPPMGSSYNRASDVFYGETQPFSSGTRTFQVSINGVATSLVSVNYNTVIGTADLTIVPIYP